MGRIAWLDTETFSTLDLKRVGADVYSRNCEIILAGLAVDKGPVKLWEVGEDPGWLLEELDRADQIVAHNAWFERNVLLRAGWCERPGEAWHCTMAQAFAHGMPAKLSTLCRFLGLPAHLQKMGDGDRLIRLFSKPQRGGKRLRKDDLPDEWAKFRRYQAHDIIAMRACYRNMPRVNLDVDLRAKAVAA